MKKEEIEKVCACCGVPGGEIVGASRSSDGKRAYVHKESCVKLMKAVLAEKDRQLSQVSVNFKFLMDIIDTIHFDLFPDKSGTWQMRAQQSAAEVRRIKGDIAKIRHALDTTEKTCTLTKEKRGSK